MASSSASAPVPATLGATPEISGPAITNCIYAYVPRPLLIKINVKNLKKYSHFKLKNDGQELIQEVFDQSNHALRMYGTAEELAAELNIFRNFTLVHEHFEYSDCDSYTTNPITYASLSQQTYISKYDVFVKLEKIVKKNCDVFAMPFFDALLAMFLKLYEEKLEHVNEFVNTSNASFKSMEDNFTTLVAKNKPKKIKLVHCTHKELREHYMKLIPGKWDSERYHIFENLLRHFCEDHSLKENKDIVEEHYSQCSGALDCLKTVINKRPEIFLPISKTKNIAHPKIVRIFQDGEKQFVSIDELPKFLGMSKKANEAHVVLTTDFSRIPESFLKKCEDPKFNIQFIKVPIIRAKHRASYIIQSCGFHLLAIDAFFEMLYNWIFGYKVFQRIQTKEDWKYVKDFMGLFKKYFDWEKNDTYFLSDCAIEHMNKFCKTIFEEFLTHPAKDVRNAKATGFTEENLKNELTHLGLTFAFPDIHDHVKKVYAHVDKNKKGSVLRTCDLFDAVFQCQLISFFKRNPQYTEFIHKQNGCSRVLETTCRCHMISTMKDTFEKFGFVDCTFGRFDPNGKPEVLFSSVGK